MSDIAKPSWDVLESGKIPSVTVAQGTSFMGVMIVTASVRRVLTRTYAFAFPSNW